MTFWDSSAIIPLLLNERYTETVVPLAKNDNALVVWWGTFIECHSAIARLLRDNLMQETDHTICKNLLDVIATGWTEIEPSQDMKNNSIRLMRLHPLKAADSLQLSAALIWADKNPTDNPFVCLDIRLREAAKKEGFLVLPEVFAL